MGTPTVFFGYPGQVWATCFSAMQTLQKQLASAPTGSASEAVALATYQTLINGLMAINAWRTQQAWQVEALNIGSVRGLTFALDPASSVYLAARAKALTLAINALNGVVPQPPFAPTASVLAQGVAAIPDPELIDFYQAFEFETPPNGLTADNLIATSQACADAFGTLADGVQAGQGVNLTQDYDTMLRLQETQQAATNMLSSAAGPFSTAGFVTSSPVSGLWNQASALPALLLDAAIVSTQPYSLGYQQVCVIRNAIILTAQQVALFLQILRTPTASDVTLGTIQQGDNLMDVAARNLGDFEQWAAIADANNLQPPYISSTPGSGVVTPGTQLLMPSGAAPSPVGVAPNYLTNFLGVDLYLGPLDEPMVPWTGDFQTISGYSNLRWALGRRLETQLGTLIYHGNYGDRIPAEVGAVKTQTEAARIAAFGKSCLLGDGRVRSVLSAVATVLPNDQISFTGVVLPKGQGAKPLSVSVTIGG